jgi:hypothetical protein
MHVSFGQPAGCPINPGSTVKDEPNNNYIVPQVSTLPGQICGTF